MNWCARQSMRVLGGPLVNMDGTHMPDWLILWEDDFEALQSYILEYVGKVVQRYRDKVSLWNCAAKLSASSVIRIDEEQRLNLTVRIIEQVRRMEPKAPLIISFDQPWGEQLSQAPLDFTPLYFADALARSGLGLSGFGLEYNLGYWPLGSNARDMLEISRQLDRWSLFGLPLVVYLTIPSSQTADPHAQSGIQAQHCLSDEITFESQNRLVERLIPLLLTKPFVQGIIWNQWDDRQAHKFPHGGLISSAGKTKPALQALRSIREETSGVRGHERANQATAGKHGLLKTNGRIFTTLHREPRATVFLHNTVNLIDHITSRCFHCCLPAMVTICLPIFWSRVCKNDRA